MCCQESKQFTLDFLLCHWPLKTPKIKRQLKKTTKPNPQSPSLQKKFQYQTPKNSWNTRGSQCFSFPGVCKSTRKAHYLLLQVWFKERLSHQLHITGVWLDKSIYLEYDMWRVNWQQEPPNRKSYSNRSVIIALISVGDRE